MKETQMVCKTCGQVWTRQVRHSNGATTIALVNYCGCGDKLQRQQKHLTPKELIDDYEGLLKAMNAISKGR